MTFLPFFYDIQDVICKQIILYGFSIYIFNITTQCFLQKESITINVFEEIALKWEIKTYENER